MRRQYRPAPARCHVAALEAVSIQQTQSNLVDRFGRRYGYEIRTRRVMFTPVKDPDIMPTSLLPQGFDMGEEAVAVRVSQTRDRSPFGPVQHYVFFHTEADAHKYVLRRLREGRARAIAKGAREEALA